MTRRDRKRVLFIRRSKAERFSQQRMMTQEEADAENRALDKLGKLTGPERWEKAT